MNFFKMFQRKNSQVLPMTVVNSLGRPARPQVTYETLSKDGYQKCVIAFRCINYIAGAISRMPLLLTKEGTDGEDEIKAHPLLTLLKNPNPMQSGVEFMRSVASYLEIKGDSFIEIAAGNSGIPQFLYAHRPDRFGITPGSNGMPASYDAMVGGAVKKFPVSILGISDILHAKLFNPLDDWFGMSPLQAAAFEIDQINESNDWNHALLKNSAVPSGVLSVTKDQYSDGSLTDNQRNQLRQMMNEQFSGSSNSGKPLILEGGLTWQGISVSPKEMDFLENKKVSKTDVAQAYGIPPQIVGIEGSQTFANFEQARMSAYQDTIIPIAELILSLLNQKLVPRFPNTQGMELGVDRDAIEALQPMRDAMWKRAQDADFITPNEKRQLVDYGKYEDAEDPADKLYVQSSMQTIEMAAEGSIDPTLVDAGDLQDDPNADDQTGDGQDEQPDGNPDKHGDHVFENKFQVINLTSRAARLKSQRDRMRVQEAMERTAAKKLKSAFVEERSLMATALEGATTQDAEYKVNAVLDKTKERFETILKTQITQVSKVFGTEIIKQVQKSVDGHETKGAQNIFDASIADFARTQAGRKITQIQGSTRKRVLAAVRRAIVESNETGESAQKVTKAAIMGVYKTFTDARANTIARTETHNAAMHAMQTGAEALRLPMTKTWVAVHDARTRDGHKEVDGQTVELQESFLVDNPDGTPDEMKGPGDSSAPAEQVINCRCVVTFSVGE